ncbi:MAG TPA: hypothetical protein VK470_07865 [Bacteroidota bacterium]|nr:hypothetical protein [Bacteroidota bacterium]
MDSRKYRLIVWGLGCVFMAYVFALLPDAFYEPSRVPKLNGPLWLIHLIFLYIHEAGHAIFKPFGSTMYFLGGSILQVLAPAVWIAVAARERSRLTVPAVFFTGYSIVDVSVYVKDAESRVLPLIGGKSTLHDWWTVLSRHDALDLALPLGETMFWVGILTSAGAIVWAVYLAVRDFQEVPAAD